MTGRAALVPLFCLAMGLSLPLSLSAQEAVSEEESAAAEHMHEHLTYISSIKTSIVMGQLEATREPARWLATHETLPNLPPSYEPFVDFMRSSARQVQSAEDLQSAATSVSRMAQNCGSCHLAFRLNLEFGYDQLPAEWTDSETHMQRHLWAMDRLWEGLIGPSDAAWKRGTKMLAEEPLHAADVSANLTNKEAQALENIAGEVHELGAASANTESLSDRSQIVGRMLGLCADCHTRIDRGPGT